MLGWRGWGEESEDEIGVKHVEETCSECGGTISKRARANVYHNLRVVCTACLHKLESRDRREEEQKSAALVKATVQESSDDDDEPTVKQIRFAEHLGIVSPQSYSKWELSEAIDEALEDRRDSGQTRDIRIVAFPDRGYRHDPNKTYPVIRDRSSSGVGLKVGLFFIVVLFVFLLILGSFR